MADTTREALRLAVAALDALTDKVDRTGFAESEEFSAALDAIDIGNRALATPEQAPAVQAGALTAQIMEQAQVFASAWSLVGGRFDFGNAKGDAERAKTELEQMVRAALATTPAVLACPSEDAIDEYLEGYEFRGDDGDYTPNERERFLMKDAIMGLLADESLFPPPTPAVQAEQPAEPMLRHLICAAIRHHDDVKPLRVAEAAADRVFDMLVRGGHIAAPRGQAEDAQRLSAELTRAKNLLVRIYDKHPDARGLIEGSTGSWFVWGQDRDAARASDARKNGAA